MLKEIFDWLTYTVFGLSEGTRAGDAINFFLYDSVKIILLLYFMIFLIGVFRTYISSKKIKSILSEKGGILSYILSSLFGAITPFCSCSSIPIFMSFIKAGVPLGISFSFLVTSPLINEYLVVLMIGFFGIKITAIYVFFGLLLGVISGLITKRLHLEDQIVEDFKTGQEDNEAVYKKFSERINYGLSEAKEIVKKLWMWILLGVGIGAFIHGFVPDELIHRVLEKTGIFAVPLATIIGIPIYANCSAVVPIAVVLFQKGVPLGTALAFMMATASLSLPEAVILRRVMKLPLIITFFSMVGIGIVIIGYLINMIYF